MKKFIFIPLLFLFVFCNAQVTKSGGFLHTGSSFSTVQAGEAAPEDDTLTLLNDGNTKAWWIAHSDYLTKDGTDSVYVWLDKTDNNNDLTATDNTKSQPVWSTDHLIFNGTQSVMYKYLTAAVTAPIFIYAAVTQLSSPVGWQDENRLMGMGSFYIKQNGTTPNIAAYAGESGTNLTQGVLDTKIVIRFLANGADGIFLINENSAGVDMNHGSNGFDRFTIGNDSYAVNTTNSNIDVYEVIIRTNADDAGEQQMIIHYLANKYDITF